MEALRRMFPEETFTNWKKLKGVLGKMKTTSLAARALPDTGAEPVRELWQKLGLQAGMAVALGDAPREFWTALGNVPEGIDYEALLGKAAMAFFFLEDPEALGRQWEQIEAVGARLPVWLIYRKGIEDAGVAGGGDRGGDGGCEDLPGECRWAGMLVKRRKS